MQVIIIYWRCLWQAARTPVNSVDVELIELSESKFARVDNTSRLRGKL